MVQSLWKTGYIFLQNAAFFSHTTQKSAPWYLPKNLKPNYWPHKNLHTDVYSSFIHNCQTWKQPRCPSVGQWINCSIPKHARVCVCSVSRLTWLFVTPWTAAHQASLSTGFFRQEYRSELPFPSPGDLPDPGIKPRFPALQADSLPSELTE